MARLPPLVDDVAAPFLLADAHRPALDLFVGDARLPVAVRADDHQVADVDGRRLLDATRLLLGGHPRAAAGALVARHQVDALNDRALGARQHLRDAPALARAAAAEHENIVPLLHVGAKRARFVAFAGRHQSTSGASEMIFMNCRSRSSRATGPKMRVPRGSPEGWITTAALSSKRSTEPSRRRIGSCVRTTTARTPSPFCTAAPG